MKKLILTVFGVLLIAGCTNDQIPNETITNSGTIKTDEALVYDFGTVDIQAGNVSRSFTLSNDSDKPLYIYEAITSCGCTTGKITVSEKDYGPFRMQSTLNEPLVVNPKSDFMVTVTYDPLFHGPTDLGRKQRTLFLFTSAEFDGSIVRTYPDKPNFTEIKVQGNVISSQF